MVCTSLEIVFGNVCKLKFKLYKLKFKLNKLKFKLYKLNLIYKFK